MNVYEGVGEKGDSLGLGSSPLCEATFWHRPLRRKLIHNDVPAFKIFCVLMEKSTVSTSMYKTDIAMALKLMH